MKKHTYAELITNAKFIIQDVSNAFFFPQTFEGCQTVVSIYDSICWDFFFVDGNEFAFPKIED